MPIIVLKLQNFNPCIQCNYVILGKRKLDILNKKRKRNTFQFQLIEKNFPYIYHVHP